jgi:hypothetical protein
MEEIVLTTEQEAVAERIMDVVAGAARAEIRQMARLLASKSNPELFGIMEFRIREIVHGIGARAFEAALEERKKGVSRFPHELSGVLRTGEIR